MNRTYIFKVVLITINAVCIVMSIQFVYQIMKIQEETIDNMVQRILEWKLYKEKHQNKD